MSSPRQKPQAEACRWCGGPLEPTRRADAHYCCASCRTKAWYGGRSLYRRATRRSRSESRP